MTALRDETADTVRFASRPSAILAAQRPPAADTRVRARRTAQVPLPAEKWRRRAEKWRSLMVAAQGGEKQAYEQLLREVDHWLRQYYARRLPPAAADDARQDALLAIHSNRNAYLSSKPFGPWIAAIARYKWIDQIRDASRFSTLSLNDEIPGHDDGEATLSVVAVNDLLRQLKPAQALVIRLVKLDGASIEDASSATGQSASLVKVNIHRGLKKLAVLAATGSAECTCPEEPLEERRL
jgi:RNA polymerase sigma factor (sigma-70 family)